VIAGRQTGARHGGRDGCGSVPWRKNAAHDGLEAASKLNVNAYDVVVLDRDPPGLRGDTLCQMITERDSRVMVLTLTAAGSAGTASAA
jgi:DNA-binding response OmpR family regulator